MSSAPKLPSIPVLGAAPSPCLTHQCSACCHDTEMLLTDADVARLAALRPGEPFWTEADDGFLQLRTRPGSEPVAGHTGERCWFLSTDGRCSVHEARPEGCRLYPAIWDVDHEAVVLDGGDCPWTDGFDLDGSTDAAVRALVARLMDQQAARSGSESSNR